MLFSNALLVLYTQDLTLIAGSMISTGFLLALALYFLRVKATVIYITPDSENCTVNDVVLEPWFSLHQLNEAALFNKSSVTLLLLSGTHVITKSKKAKNVSELALRIHHWNELEIVKI